jgi:hypothetical protein
MAWALAIGRVARGCPRRSADKTPESPVILFQIETVRRGCVTQCGGLSQLSMAGSSGLARSGIHLVTWCCDDARYRAPSAESWDGKRSPVSLAPRWSLTASSTFSGAVPTLQWRQDDAPVRKSGASCLLVLSILSGRRPCGSSRRSCLSLCLALNSANSAFALDILRCQPPEETVGRAACLAWFLARWRSEPPSQKCSPDLFPSLP